MNDMTNKVYSYNLYEDFSSLIFSCEHASNRIYDLHIPANEKHYFDEHWAYDLGIERLTRDLSTYFKANAIYAEFSRLLIDPNRELTSEMLIPNEINGKKLSFNQNCKDLESFERGKRIKELYIPYHQALSSLCSKSTQESRGKKKKSLLISMHSFTPVFNGKERDLEVGVLCNAHDDLAEKCVELFSKSGFNTKLNQPYSGKKGFIFSAQKHGQEHNIPYLELEFRQDLLINEKSHQHLLKQTKTALKDLIKILV